jgi:hypothetical protein
VLAGLISKLPMLGRVGAISSIYSGIWLLCEIAAAAVLAFWMPPIVRGEPPKLPAEANPVG